MNSTIDWPGSPAYGRERTDHEEAAHQRRMKARAACRALLIPQEEYAAHRCPRVAMRPASYWHWRFENHLSTPVLFPFDWR